MIPLQLYNYGLKCWWCGNKAESSEHKFKRTDIISEFGPPPYKSKDALIRHVGDEIITTSIQGPKSKQFKFRKGLCSKCNNFKSKPIDLAYESFINYIKINKRKIEKYRIIDFNDIFEQDWLTYAKNVRHYFIKHACCRISDAGLRIGEDLIKYLNGWTKCTTFNLLAEIRLDIHERFCNDSNQFGSLWLGDLIGWHAPNNSQNIRVQSFYGLGCIRFSWIYDTLEREWPDNMSDQLIILHQGRTVEKMSN